MSRRSRARRNRARLPGANDASARDPHAVQAGAEGVDEPEPPEVDEVDEVDDDDGDDDGGVPVTRDPFLPVRFRGARFEAIGRVAFCSPGWERRPLSHSPP